MGKTDKIKHKKVKGERLGYKSVSLPTSLAEDLAILRECYEDTWFPVKEEYGPKKRRQAVSYEKVFERLLSKSGLGHVDPDVYQEYMKVRETRKKFPEVVKLTTRKAVEELVARAEANGTSLKEEAMKEQQRVKEEMEASRAEKDAAAKFLSDFDSYDPVAEEEKPQERRTEKRFVHPDGRWYRAEMGSTTWVPVNPETGRWMSAKPLKEEGFELKDVEL